jgi:hypothetical protein
MTITDDFIYLELQKTGSTHVTKLLQQLHKNNFVKIGKHNTIKTMPKHVLVGFESKIKVGNIRNPWDWYVSLWSFGCQKRGGLHKMLTKPIGGKKSFMNQMASKAVKKIRDANDIQG